MLHAATHCFSVLLPCWCMSDVNLRHYLKVRVDVSFMQVLLNWRNKWYRNLNVRLHFTLETVKSVYCSDKPVSGIFFVDFITFGEFLFSSSWADTATSVNSSYGCSALREKQPILIKQIWFNYIYWMENQKTGNSVIFVYKGHAPKDLGQNQLCHVVIRADNSSNAWNYRAIILYKCGWWFYKVSFYSCHFREILC